MYWRYEMAVRGLESRLASVTAGNGAIYAVRRDAYVEMPSDRGHDLCLPYLTVRNGMRAVYEPAAQAEEPMAPTMTGEWERKRRMMNRTWGILLNDGMLSPRGYGPLYAYEMLSHRGLRYASPFLHLIALGTNVALLGEGTVYAVTLGLQLGAAGRRRARAGRAGGATPHRGLLRVGDRVDRRRIDRPDPLGARDDVGARGGDQMRMSDSAAKAACAGGDPSGRPGLPRALDLVDRGARTRRLPRRCCWSRRSRSSSIREVRSSTASSGWASSGAHVRDVEAPHHGPRRAARRRSGTR